jgi:F-type H+-transporting ATPase subunit epsilon
MTQQLHLQIVSPAQSVMDAPVDMVEIPGLEGDFGVLPGHAPFFSMIRPGVITVYQAGTKTRLFATSGYAEVSPEGCIVLSDHIQDMSTITREQAQEALETAERDLAHAESAAEKAKATKKIEQSKVLLAAL